MIKTSSIEFLKEICQFFINQDTVDLICEQYVKVLDEDESNDDSPDFFIQIRINEHYLIDDISFLDLINFDKITIDLSEANFGDGMLDLIINKSKMSSYQCDIIIPLKRKKENR
jgi:hypothetical protein